MAVACSSTAQTLEPATRTVGSTSPSEVVPEPVVSSTLIPPSSQVLASSVPPSSLAVDVESSVPPTSVVLSTTLPTTNPPTLPPLTTVASQQPRTVTFVIPPGTAERIERGEDVGEVLPASLTLRVGDTLVLDNRDTTYHLYGPISARSGEVVRWVVPSAGTFIGTCTANTDRQIVLTVVEA